MTVHLDQLPEKPGLYVPGHAKPGTEHGYRIFALNDGREWSEIGNPTKSHTQVVAGIYDSWLPLKRLTVGGEADLGPIIQALYRTPFIDRVPDKTVDAIAAVLVSHAEQIQNYVARGEERDNELRRIRADRAAFRRYVGLPVEVVGE